MGQHTDQITFTEGDILKPNEYSYGVDTAHVVGTAQILQETFGTRPAAEYMYRSGVSLEIALETLAWRSDEIPTL